MICTADKPVYCRNVLTCESSVYVQRDEARTLYSRRILPQNFASILIRHSHDWIYSFSSKQQVSLKCRQNATWITSTWSLQGSGILHNASACHVMGQLFQLYLATEGHSVSNIEYHFYWYFTIPTFTVTFLAIMICNGYPYLLRNLLHKIRCITQPAENSTPGNKSRSSSEVFPKQQPSTGQLQSNENGRKSEFVTYPAQTAA
jgi:hypothetical protein